VCALSTLFWERAPARTVPISGLPVGHSQACTKARDDGIRPGEKARDQTFEAFRSRTLGEPPAASSSQEWPSAPQLVSEKLGLLLVIQTPPYLGRTVSRTTIQHRGGGQSGLCEATALNL
jgi:hypothetical protein